mmetsp:Transcript_3561/g.12561  ORF Transcript_3561/g.12561 Transcript_3561/m.12561 type:complete len:337 (-) Transcript_3561:427-1437(-)
MLLRKRILFVTSSAMSWVVLCFTLLVVSMSSWQAIGTARNDWILRTTVRLELVRLTSTLRIEFSSLLSFVRTWRMSSFGSSASTMRNWFSCSLERCWRGAITSSGRPVVKSLAKTEMQPWRPSSFCIVVEASASELTTEMALLRMTLFVDGSWRTTWETPPLFSSSLRTASTPIMPWSAVSARRAIRSSLCPSNFKTIGRPFSSHTSSALLSLTTKSVRMVRDSSNTAMSCDESRLTKLVIPPSLRRVGLTEAPRLCTMESEGSNKSSAPVDRHFRMRRQQDSRRKLSRSACDWKPTLARTFNAQPNRVVEQESERRSMTAFVPRFSSNSLFRASL